MILFLLGLAIGFLIGFGLATIHLAKRIRAAHGLDSNTEILTFLDGLIAERRDHSV